MWFPSGSEQADLKMFVARALERMLAERDIKRSNNAALRKAAQDALERIQRDQQKQSNLPGQQQPLASGPNKPPNNTPLPAPGEITERTAAQQSIEPFTLALKSQSKRLTIIAIDCLQKLIAYNHLTSEDAAENIKSGTAESSGATNMIERVCEDICSCFNSPCADDDVYLQIVKALLTIMASDRVQVHGDTLLLIIRTCYNVYLFGKQRVVQETASGSLVQMLNKIMSHVEDNNVGRVSSGIKPHSVKESTPIRDDQPSVDEDGLPPEPDDAYYFHADVLRVVHDVVLAVEEEAESPQTSTVDNDTSTHSVHAVYARCRSAADSSQSGLIDNDAVSVRSSDTATENGTTSPTSPTSARRHDAPQRAISLASTMSVTSSPHATAPSRSSPRPLPVSSSSASDNIPPPSPSPSLTVYEKDALNVFRSLCKLSTKEVHDSGAVNTSDSGKNIEFRNKVLCLRLLLSILEGINSQTSILRHAPFFIEALRKHMCVSLSRNGVSPVLEVFQLSLSIFLQLVFKFRVYLKVQIGVMFKEIFLNILESSSSSYAHKLAVVDALTKVCSDAQLIVDLFVNYDCDLSAPNVFARLIDNLSRVAQGKNAQALGGVAAGNSQTAPSAQQQAAIRLKGFEALSSILTCLVEWLSISKQQQQRTSDTAADNNSLPRVETSASQLSESSNMPNGGGGGENDAETTTLSARLEEVKIQKDIVEQGIALFAKKPRRGLEFLLQNGIINDSPDEIAVFFHQEERLDKSQIGDFLSENNDYSRAIMHAYVDHIDFAGKDIVSALRQFLEGYRLPGEAQKIDRLMEKFASRYCETNSDLDIFASADTAYVLAYSIIMLTTDLHSPQVKHKMTKEQYIRMNRGINDQQDLPEDFLSKIFDEIAVNEIRMKPSIPAVQPTAAAGGSGGASGAKSAADSSATSRQKQLLYNLEMEQVSKVAHALMESASHIKSEFLEARDTHFVKPIFKLLWTPLLAAFSILLQDAMSLRQSIATSSSANSSSNKEPLTLFGSEERDYYAVSIALQSLRKGMHIACRYLLELERDAYLQALVGFTHLSASPSSGSMNSAAHSAGMFAHQHSVNASSHSSSYSSSSTTNVSAVVVDEKNLLAVREIIRIAQEDGNYLGYSNWHEILKRISQLDLTHIVQDRDKMLMQAQQERQQRAAANSGTKLLFFRDPVSALIPGLNKNSVSAASEKLTMDEISSQTSAQSSPAAAANAHATLTRMKSVSRATQDRALASTSPVAFAILQCLDESEMQDFLVSIDRIFSASTQLDGESVVTFVRALCAVSLEELRQQPRPKIFCLQKIVEISYYNMDRVRLQWSRIWQIMSEYYKHVFLLENEEISCFAVDSLRQLSVKFLEKGEVAHFRFQNEFLKPFEFVLKKTQSNVVRDMTVRCIVHIANSQAARLRSGWKNIFNVWFIVAAAAPLPPSSSPSNVPNQNAVSTTAGTLQRGSKQQQSNNAKTKKVAGGGRKTSAAGPDDDAVSISSQTTAAAPPSAHVQLLEISFEALSNVVVRVYEQHFAYCVESFQDCVKCLSEFACTDEAGAPDMSMEAIRLIRRCADCVADNELVFNERLVLMSSAAQNAAAAASAAAETPTTTNKSIATPTTIAPTPVTATASSTQIAASHERAWVNGWFPVIFELTCVVCRCKLDVRTRALTVLFEILKTHGQRFKDVWWLDIFQVVLRMFDGLKLPDRQQHEKQEWMTTTCSHALFSIVDVVTQHFDVLGHLVIEQVYGLITWCIQQQNNEQLARSAINCFETLVTTNADRFDAELWNKTCAAMCGLFNATLPATLLQWQPPTTAGGGKFDSEDMNLDEFVTTSDAPDVQQQQNTAKSRRGTRTGSITSIDDNHKQHRQKPSRPTQLAVDGDVDNRNSAQQLRAADDLQAMLLNCVLQIELIQALDNMLFSSLGASRRQEAVIAKFFVNFDPYRTLETIRESAQTQAVAAAMSGAKFTAAAASAAVGTSLTAFYATQKQLSPALPRRLPPNTNTPVAAAAAGNMPSGALPPSTDRNTASNFSSSNSDEGVLKYLSFAQATQLAQVLHQSCMLARTFNLNDAQRELLWREGLCGRSKPNLFKQETYSFVTLIRLHFALVQRNLDKLSQIRTVSDADERSLPSNADGEDEQQVRSELFATVRTTIDLCNDTLVYYADTITHDNHRQAWTAPVLTLAWSLVQPTLVSSVMAFLQDVVSTALSASTATNEKPNIPFYGLCEILGGSSSLPSSSKSVAWYHSSAASNNLMLANGNGGETDRRIGDNIYVGKNTSAVNNKSSSNAAVQLLDSQQAFSLAVYREFYRHLFLNLSKVFNLVESPVEIRKATQCLFALNYLLFIA